MQFTLSPLHLGLLLEFQNAFLFLLILPDFLGLLLCMRWLGYISQPREVALCRRHLMGSRSAPLWLPDLCSRDAPRGGRRGPSVGGTDYCGCAGSLDHPLAQVVARASWAEPPSPLINGAQSHGS